MEKPVSERLDGGPIYKKAYGLHADAHAFYPDPGAVPRVLEQAMTISSVAANMPTKFRNLPVKHPYRKHPSQYNDPLCVYAIIDLMVRAQRGIYLRASYLIPELTREWPLYFWRAISIGRTMSGIQYACQVAYAGETAGDRPKYVTPIERGRDAKGPYYVIDPAGGNEGLLWLLKSRDVLVEWIENMMLREAAGDLDHSLIGLEQGFNHPSDLYPHLLPGCIREPEFYLAQCDMKPFPAPMRGHGRGIVDPFAS